MAFILPGEILSQRYVEYASKDGCCGMKELLKLESFRMIQYSKVVMLDSDIIILQRIDDELLSVEDILFRYDHGGHSPKHCMQGGFLIIRPSMLIYNGLKALVGNATVKEGGNKKQIEHSEGREEIRTVKKEGKGRRNVSLDRDNMKYI